MNIQDILDDLDAGEHIPNSVVRELCNEYIRLNKYVDNLYPIHVYNGADHYMKKTFGDWKINNE